MRERSVLMVALSGVRVVDPELRALGLTLPGFVERGRTIASLPSLGLLTLAAHTPPHWRVAYRDLDAIDDADVAEIVAGGHDLVAISALTARIGDAYRLADTLRAAGLTVALGGLHASACPQEAAAHADVVVVGQGESAWESVLHDIDTGCPRAVYSAPFDLCASRVPRFDLLDAARYDRITVQTTRGCPLDCAFCAASRTISPYQRKPVSHVQREIEAILDVWPRPFLELADDNTFLDKRWSRELVDALAQYGLRWFTETDASLADDEELLGAVAAAGCAQVLIGFESVDAVSLGDVDPRRWKQGRAASAAQSIRRIQEAGVSVNGCFVLGLDGDDPGIFERTRDFVRESGLAEVQVTLLTPFPGTELRRRLAAEGRLHADAGWDRCTLFDVTFEPRGMSAAELRAGFLWLVGELYGDDAVAARRRAFRDCVRASRTARGRSDHDA